MPRVTRHVQVAPARRPDVPPPPARVTRKPPEGRTSTTVGLLALAVLACLILYHSQDLFFQTAVGTIGTVTAIKTFSPPLARGMYPGFLTNADGSSYCLFPDLSITLQECDQATATIDMELRSQPSDYIELMKAAKAEGPKGVSVSPGFELDPPTNIRTFMIGADPKTYENHEKALQFLETHVLKNDGFFNQPPATILKTMQKTHRLLMDQLSFDDPKAKAGEFRKVEIIAKGARVADTLEGYRAELVRNGGTPTDVSHFEKSYERINDPANTEGLSPAEETAWRKLAHIPPVPHKIPKQMHLFIHRLKQKMDRMVHERASVIATAAWAHQQIGSILPFADGNGRLARLWMNTVLQRGGVHGVLFYDETAYTDAVRIDQTTPGHFAQFLEEIIEWNERNGFIRPVF